MLFSLPEPALAPLRVPSRASLLASCRRLPCRAPARVPCLAVFSTALLATPLLATEPLPRRAAVRPALAEPAVPAAPVVLAEEEETSARAVSPPRPPSPCLIPLAIDIEPLRVPPRAACGRCLAQLADDLRPPLLLPLPRALPLLPRPLLQPIRLPPRCALTATPFESVPAAPVFARDEDEARGGLDAPPRGDVAALAVPPRIRLAAPRCVDELPVPVLPPTHDLPLLPRPRRIHAVSVRRVVHMARKLAAVPHMSATAMLLHWLALLRPPASASQPVAPDHGRTLELLARLTAPQYTDADPGSLPTIFETVAQRARKLRAEASESTVARQQLASTSTLLVLLQVRIDAVRGGVTWALERLRQLLARDEIDSLRLARRRLDAAVELLESLEAQHADVVHPRVVAVRQAALLADHVRVRCGSEGEARAIQAALQTDLRPAHAAVGPVYLESEYVAYLDAQARARHRLESHVSDVRHALQTSCRVLLHW